MVGFGGRPAGQTCVVRAQRCGCALGVRGYRASSNVRLELADASDQRRLSRSVITSTRMIGMPCEEHRHADRCGGGEVAAVVRWCCSVYRTKHEPEGAEVSSGRVGRRDGAPSPVSAWVVFVSSPRDAELSRAIPTTTSHSVPERNRRFGAEPSSSVRSINDHVVSMATGTAASTVRATRSRHPSERPWTGGGESNRRRSR